MGIRSRSNSSFSRSVGSTAEDCYDLTHTPSTHNHHTQHVEQILQDFRLVERLGVVAPPPTQHHQQLLHPLLHLTPNTPTYGVFCEGVHTLLVGTQGEKQFGRVHHHLVVVLALQEVQQVARQLRLPVALHHTMMKPP